MNNIKEITQKYNELRKRSFKNELSNIEKSILTNLHTKIVEHTENSNPCKICKNRIIKGNRVIKYKDGSIISTIEFGCSVINVDLFNTDLKHCSSFGITKL